MTHIATRPPQMEPSPLERAFDNYQQMEAENTQLRRDKAELMIENQKLASEAQMLREMLKISDADRIRLQAFSSTLMGRLLSINDAIAGAVKDSVRHGVEAVHADTDKQDGANSETQEDIQPTPHQDATADRLPAPVNWKPN